MARSSSSSSSSNGKINKGEGESVAHRAAAAGKDGKKTRRNKPPSEKNKDGEEHRVAVVAAAASASSDSSDGKEGPVRGKVVEASKTINDRDALRADVMTQVQQKHAVVHDTCTRTTLYNTFSFGKHTRSKHGCITRNRPLPVSFGEVLYEQYVRKYRS